MSSGKIVVGFRMDDPNASAFAGRHGFRLRLPAGDTPDLSGEVYEGPYEVRPTPAGQTLATEGKTMKDDVTIEPIPYFVVSNEAGGETVYIGE